MSELFKEISKRLNKLTVKFVVNNLSDGNFEKQSAEEKLKEQLEKIISETFKEILGGKK